MNKPPILVPLESKGKWGKTVFIEIERTELKEYNWVVYIAYLRKSTKKKEQALSIERQNDSVVLMAKHIGVPVEYINVYSDSFTGYKIKTINGTPQVKRKGWKTTTELIRKLKKPCVLLAFDPSRLTRNVPDGVTVKELLWHYWNIQKLECIRFFDGSIWDKNTPESIIDNEVAKAVTYSEVISRNKKSRNRTSLEMGILPKTIKTPKWLKATYEGLIETDDMVYVREAFEMKAKGVVVKDIVKYLHSKKITANEWSITEKIFQNELYIGKYYYDNTGKLYSVKYVSGMPSISQELWWKVQKTIGKKVGIYSEWQKGDILKGKLKTKSGRVLSAYQPTKKLASWETILKSKQYQNITEKIRISELRVLECFLEQFQQTLHNIFFSSIHTLEDDINKAYKEGVVSISPYKWRELFEDSEYREVKKEALEKTRRLIERIKETSFEDIQTVIREKYKQDNSELFIAIEEERRNLELEKERMEKDIKAYRRYAAIKNYTDAEIEETSKEMKKDIEAVNEKLSNYELRGSFEEELVRLPWILQKTFELGGKVLQERKKSNIKEDILKLIELTTFELTLDTKKELTVKLFDVLTDLENLNGGRWWGNIRTFIENYDRVKEKYGNNF